MIKVGSIWEKTGNRWCDDRGELVIITYVNDSDVVYRWLDLESEQHDSNGGWTIITFLSCFTEVL
jgi:hypothetical protein